MIVFIVLLPVSIINFRLNFIVNAQEPNQRVIKSFNENISDKPVISLNDTLSEIYSPGSKFEIKQHFLGPNFKLHNDGKISLNSCAALFHSILKENTGGQQYFKDCRITEELQKAFTLDHLVHGEETCPTVQKQTLKKHNKSNNTWIWTKQKIKSKMGTFKTCSVYKNSACEESVSQYKHYIEGKVGMVLGTLIPWAEGGLIKHGAKEIITVEYNPIVSLHPKIKAVHPTDLASQYINNNFTSVDFIFAYSSLEHDGLGRYGDPINPYGDLESIARAHCMLKQDGVPIGPDHIETNHRIYGKESILYNILNLQI